MYLNKIIQIDSTITMSMLYKLKCTCEKFVKNNIFICFNEVDVLFNIPMDSHSSINSL